jgi:hypothetical protein
MSSPSALRERAARYLDLAKTARHRGDIRLATLLTDRAVALIDQSEASEAGQIIPPPSPAAAQPNVQQQQQQQQIQPKDGNE